MRSCSGKRNETALRRLTNCISTLKLIKNGKKVTAFVPNDGEHCTTGLSNEGSDILSGCLNFVDENDEVLLAGFGRKGKAKGYVFAID
jgi:ribosomal protein S12